MIDTIHFRINSISKYYALENQFSTQNKEGFTEVQINQDTLETSGGSEIRAILYHDYDRVIPITRRASLNIPSSNYNISYSLNKSRDFLEFNLSLPKYEFSTNILQSINYYDQSAESQFFVLLSFFDDFIKSYFIQKPDYEDIEIRRIDLCYNQFFSSKRDALDYLNLQKDLNAKYARSSKNNFRSYDTSLMYVTGRYSFKIYHKGTEFEKHDKVQLYKNNIKGYDVQDLQYHADRILRYEMTFRSSMLNYIFKNDIVKSDVHNDFTQILKFARKRFGRSINNVIDDYLSKSLNFCLESPHQKIRGKNVSYEDFFNEYRLPFDKQLFERIYSRFWKKVKDYQLNVRMSMYDIIKKIEENEEINETKNQLRKVRKSNPHKTRLVTLALLSQYTNIKQIKDLVGERTYYRYKADLKKLGISEFNGNDSIPPPSLDYQEYKYYFGKYYHAKRNFFIKPITLIQPNKNF